jgi:hypothetical protein
MKRLSVLLLLFFCLSPAQAQKITEKVAGMEKFPGFFTFYWDAKAGKIWLEIDKWNTEFLYVESLPAGIGSNDIGLDRGQLGSSSIVRFDRTGPRVLLVAPNYNFRATSNNADERLAVRDAFAESTLWALISPLKKALAFWLTRRSFICATSTGSPIRCKEDSRASTSSMQLAARSIFQTRRTFRKTQKLKPR